MKLVLSFRTKVQRTGVEESNFSSWGRVMMESKVAQIPSRLCGTRNDCKRMSLRIPDACQECGNPLPVHTGLSIPESIHTRVDCLPAAGWLQLPCFAMTWKQSHRERLKGVRRSPLDTCLISFPGFVYSRGDYFDVPVSQRQ
jgi:hypothetical protein